MRIDGNAQSEELYVIRKQQAHSEQSQPQVQPVKADEYDKANPVGGEAEGVYSVSHDESGNLKVDYKPTAKSEAKAAPVTSSSDDDDELEELKEQREALRQQLNRATDEDTKQALRVQLQSVELQIAMKSAQ